MSAASYEEIEFEVVIEHQVVVGRVLLQLVAGVLQPDGDLLLVPYYAWAHRGVGEMKVWFKRNPQ